MRNIPLNEREFEMAKGTLYTFSASIDGASMVYADGSSDAVQWSDLTDQIRAHLMAHGWKQKVADGAAKSRDPETGRSATDGEKISAMRAIAQRLAAGVWAIAGGGGGASSEKMLLIRALAEFSGKSLDDARAFVEGKTKTQQTALTANVKIRSIVDRMRAESVSMVDSDELLDGFMDE